MLEKTEKPASDHVLFAFDFDRTIPKGSLDDLASRVVVNLLIEHHIDPHTLGEHDFYFNACKKIIEKMEQMKKYPNAEEAFWNEVWERVNKDQLDPFTFNGLNYKQLFTEILATGQTLIIVTYNRYPKLVTRYLKDELKLSPRQISQIEIFSDNPFDEYNHHKTDKNQLLIKAKTRTDYRMVFIDDSEENIQKAKELFIVDSRFKGSQAILATMDGNHLSVVQSLARKAQFKNDPRITYSFYHQYDCITFQLPESPEELADVTREVEYYIEYDIPFAFLEKHNTTVKQVIEVVRQAVIEHQMVASGPCPLKQLAYKDMRILLDFCEHNELASYKSLSYEVGKTRDEIVVLYPDLYEDFGKQKINIKSFYESFASFDLLYKHAITPGNLLNIIHKALSDGTIEIYPGQNLADPQPFEANEREFLAEFCQANELKYNDRSIACTINKLRTEFMKFIPGSSPVYRSISSGASTSGSSGYGTTSLQSLHDNSLFTLRDRKRKRDDEEKSQSPSTN